MGLKLSTCFILVDDPERALAFYRDALELEVRNDVARDAFRWITIGSAAQREVGIVLTNYLSAGPADRETIAGLLAKGALGGVHFQCADLDAVYEKVKASGADIVEEPTDQPWGARDFALRDPAGNLLRINQAPTA
jgi:predicted enzyme related to lactoylglutathione lyase